MGVLVTGRTLGSTFCLLIFSVCFVTSGVARAQVLYGSILGNVMDASNAPVPGATVTITSMETNQSRETTTNESGGYTFSTVPSGTYELKVVREGFQVSTRRDIVVTINSVARADLTLQVGAVSQVVEVVATAALLQSDRSEVRAETWGKTCGHRAS